MALADNYRILEYVSDGKQVEFPVLWRFFDPDTVLVKIYSKDGILINHLSYGRDYSVIATGEDTGRVTLTAPVASGLLVVIYRLEPYVQLLELLNSGKFDLVKLEETLDHIVMLCQQNRDEILRCLKVPPGSDMTGDEFIDDLLNKYNEIILIFETIKKLLQNLVCQTIEPFTTKAGVRKYYVGEGLPLDPKLYNLLLVLGGVVQEPKQSYTIVDENHIEFTENPPAGLRGWGISAISTSTPDLRQMVQDALSKLAYATTTTHGIMMVGDGLSVSKGRVSVDFSEMPTDKFEALLKQIRVPIWIDKSTTFYVNSSTGSDALDAGRGASPDKPFKTLQACANYISANYNVSKYVLSIFLAPGTYSIAELPTYSRTTGYCAIKGDKSNTFIDVSTTGTSTGINADGSYWHIDGLTVRVTTENITQNKVYSTAIIADNYAYIRLTNVAVELRQTTNSGSINRLRGIEAIRFGSIDIREGCSVKSMYEDTQPNRMVGLIAYSDGRITLQYPEDSPSPLDISGEYSVVAAAEGGAIERATPNLGIVTGSATGKRYQATLGGSISTKGAGEEYFPGSQNGTVESTTFSWYK